MKKISTDQAEALLDEDVTYLDVRTPEEYADGHVPGAVNVPWLLADGSGKRAPNPEFLTVVSASFEKDQPLIVGCKAGGRSAAACAALSSSGFTQLSDMTAGWAGGKDPFGQPIPGWSQEGREIETDAEEDRTYLGMKKLASS